MEVFRQSADLKNLLGGGSSLTVGTFDGVHLGHKALIEYTVERAQALGLKSLVLTFEPHPVYVLRPEIEVERIALADEKIERLSKFGLDYLLILNFNIELANFKAIDFFNEILIGDLNARFIALGYNHTFGKNREGNLEFLKQVAPDKGCDVGAVDPLIFEEQPISSSRIRRAIKDGQVDKANKMLNQPFTLPGRVVSGKGLGNKIGFPTINIVVPEGKLMPRAGVYAATCRVADRDIPGMMYIHPRPDKCDLEVNLFGFDEDIYNTATVVQPLKFTREPVVLPDPESIKNRLAEDEKEIKHFFEIN